MDISSLTPPAQAAAAAAPSGASGDAPDAALSSDFETFLKMLTVQLQNQDPLNPVEASDFAVQLATFSSVEQQVRTNDLLVSLGDRLGAQSVGQLTSWIGMNAMAEIPVRFEGAPVSLTVHPDPDADSAELVVRDADGTAIQRLPFDPALGQVEWAGIDDSGSPLPAGDYVLETESFVDGVLTETRPVEVGGLIVEARQNDGQAVLKLENGQKIPAALITSVSAP